MTAEKKPFYEPSDEYAGAEPRQGPLTHKDDDALRVLLPASDHRIILFLCNS
jgi:hypothetical protein